ncbi:MAG: MerR family transcriptional regulator [Rhodobacteraceae bacterium]|nr:MerR family transcriptional regulator [Paracoccaceae bacterium]
MTGPAMTKSAEAFRTISEVSAALDTPAHVLRFWESRFSQIRPVKRAGGRRYYRPEDIALIAGIRKLLHEDGLTIRGVQKILREKGVRHVASLSDLPRPGGGSDAAADAPGAREAAPPSLASAPQDEAVAPAPAPQAPPDEAPARPAVGVAAAAPMPGPAPMQDSAPDQPAPVREDATPGRAAYPAASLLRAMDALRAGEKRDELAAIFRRLEALRNRVADS